MTGGTPSNTNLRDRALAALQIWQMFEYLNPQKPPKPELNKDTCVWALNHSANGDEQMPWKDRTKIANLERLFKYKRRYMLFGGIIDGPELIETIRELLGAPAVDLSEQRKPKDAASFVISIDERGYVAGEVFVSTIPWAVSCIKAAHSTAGLFDFSGFFGDDGVQQRVKDAVNTLLVQRLLITAEPAVEEPVTEKAFPQSGGGPQVHPMKTQDSSVVSADVASNPADLRPLDAADVRAIADVIFSTCGWRPSIDTNWVIQTLRAPANGQGKASDDPLNSFYGEELEHIQQEYLAGRAGKTLLQFLEPPLDPERHDLEDTRHHLINGVHPNLTPRACWPGEYPLVTAQQFAVNAIMRDLKTGGLFSVNGPPGTGKTTLLKDILASIVLQRADVLASFNDPNEAFPSKLTVERHDYPVWRIHDRLQGFGIVVACANNGAAENISKELPGLAAIDQAVSIDYFSEVADSIGLSKDAKQRTPMRWGLISAALGKQENRFAFATDFWEGRKDKSGGKTRAKNPEQNKGNLQPSEPPDPLRPLTLRDWVNEFGSQVPTWTEAQSHYAAAKRRAEVALERTGTLATQLRRHEELTSRIADLRARQARLGANSAELKLQVDEAKTLVASSRANMDRAGAIAMVLGTLEMRRAELEIAQDGLTGVKSRAPGIELSELVDSIRRVEQARDRVQQDLASHASTKPGAVAAFFSREGARRWTARNELLSLELDATRMQLDTLEHDRDRAILWQRDLADSQQKTHALLALTKTALNDVRACKIDESLSCHDAVSLAKIAEDNYQSRCDTLREIEKKAKRAVQEEQECSAVFKEHNDALNANAATLKAAGLLDGHRDAWHLFDASRDDFHRASPYHDDVEVFHARRDLFAAAMDLHKAFIVHSWRKLQTVLFACVGMLQGKISPGQIHGGPMPLWDALFLVVPLISTTFASFPRLFRGVGKEQLAWVLIDEAGQAAPQYCVGALWRAQRAVVVGDPLQLEPVVSVPEELVGPLRERCGTDHCFVPPGGSAQTIADLSNRFGMYLNQGEPDKRIWLGSPLVVHRRCVSPMFEISNAIAYENKMVYGGGKDQLAAEVPISCWLDAATDGNEGHWIPSQGERVIQGVRKLVGSNLRNKEGKLRVFVITPFSKVAEKMLARLTAEFGWDDAREMCGTVHTFQGKEADFVLFLLGGDPKKPGVISTFAGKNPNLVNVAVTRAKKRLYVMGNRAYWTGRNDIHGYYAHMAEVLDIHQAEMKELRAEISS